MTGARACGCRTVRGFTAAESALLKGQGGRVLPIRDVMDVMRNNASSDSKFMMHVFDPEFFNSMQATGLPQCCAGAARRGAASPARVAARARVCVRVWWPRCRERVRRAVSRPQEVACHVLPS